MGGSPDTGNRIDANRCVSSCDALPGLDGICLHHGWQTAWYVRTADGQQLGQVIGFPEGWIPTTNEWEALSRTPLPEDEAITLVCRHGLALERVEWFETFYPWDTPAEVWPEQVTAPPAGRLVQAARDVLCG